MSWLSCVVMCRLAARGSRSADLFKRSSDTPADAAALKEHLDKLNKLEAQGGGPGAAGAQGEGEGDGEEPVDVVQDEDDDDVMEEDDYYQVGGVPRAFVEAEASSCLLAVHQLLYTAHLVPVVESDGCMAFWQPSADHSPRRFACCLMLLPLLQAWPVTADIWCCSCFPDTFVLVQGEYFDDDEGYDDLGDDGNEDGPVY